MSVNPEQLKHIVEAALMAHGQPLTVEKIVQLFVEDEQPSKDDIKAALEDIQQDCQNRGIELQEVGSGYRFQARKEFAPWVSRLWEEKPPRYSRALLETLVLIAYRQPITRGEIEDIRGVSVSSHIMKTLLEREWVRVVGHKDVPGRPAIYASTKDFLDYFNLKSLDELPSLAEIRDLDKINAELGLEDPKKTEGEGDAEAQQQAEEIDDDQLIEASSSQEKAQQPQSTDTLAEETGSVNEAVAATNEESIAELDNESVRVIASQADTNIIGEISHDEGFVSLDDVFEEIKGVGTGKLSDFEPVESSADEPMLGEQEVSNDVETLVTGATVATAIADTNMASTTEDHEEEFISLDSADEEPATEMIIVDQADQDDDLISLEDVALEAEAEIDTENESESSDAMLAKFAHDQLSANEVEMEIADEIDQDEDFISLDVAEVEVEALEMHESSDSLTAELVVSEGESLKESFYASELSEQNGPSQEVDDEYINLDEINASNEDSADTEEMVVTEAAIEIESETSLQDEKKTLSALEQ